MRSCSRTTTTITSTCTSIGRSSEASRRSACRSSPALGVGAHLERWGVPASRIVELDWWETTRVGALTIAAGSARHFSGRGLTGSNRTLWASWSIIGPKHRVFHSGDTGQFDGIAENGRRYGPFDMALIKIGAYGETWPDIHLTPEQAVHACTLVKGKLLLPIHWGTFNLAYHDWNEPAERVAAATAAGVPLACPSRGNPSTSHRHRRSTRGGD